MPKVNRVIPAAMYRDPTAIALGEFSYYGSFGAAARDNEDYLKAGQVQPGTYYGRPGDSWDKWCNRAADLWAEIRGNADEAEDQRVKCVNGNVSWAPPLPCPAPAPLKWVEPWSWCGKIGRGLNLSFDVDPKIVSEGLAGTVTRAVEAGKQVVTDVKKEVEKVVPSGGTASESQPAVVDALPGVKMRTPPRTVDVDDLFARKFARKGTGTPLPMFIPGGLPPPPPPEVAKAGISPMVLALGAVAAVGAVMLLRRRKSPMAGFGAYRRRRVRR